MKRPTGASGGDKRATQSALSGDILYEVMVRLQPEGIVFCGQVSHKLYEVASSEAVWSLKLAELLVGMPASVSPNLANDITPAERYFRCAAECTFERERASAYRAHHLRHLKRFGSPRGVGTTRAEFVRPRGLPPLRLHGSEYGTVCELVTLFEPRGNAFEHVAAFFGEPTQKGAIVRVWQAVEVARSKGGPRRDEVLAEALRRRVTFGGSARVAASSGGRVASRATPESPTKRTLARKLAHRDASIAALQQRVADLEGKLQAEQARNERLTLENLNLRRQLLAQRPLANELEVAKADLGRAERRERVSARAIQNLNKRCENAERESARAVAAEAAAKAQADAAKQGAAADKAAAKELLKAAREQVKKAREYEAQGRELHRVYARELARARAPRVWPRAGRTPPPSARPPSSRRGQTVGPLSSRRGQRAKRLWRWRGQRGERRAGAVACWSRCRPSARPASSRRRHLRRLASWSRRSRRAQGVDTSVRPPAGRRRRCVNPADRPASIRRGGGRPLEAKASAAWGSGDSLGTADAAAVQWAHNLSRRHGEWAAPLRAAGKVKCEVSFNSVKAIAPHLTGNLLRMLLRQLRSDGIKTECPMRALEEYYASTQPKFKLSPSRTTTRRRTQTRTARCSSSPTSRR